MGAMGSRASRHVRRWRMAKEAGVAPHLVEFLYQKFKQDSGKPYITKDLLSPEFVDILIDSKDPDGKLSLDDYIRFLLVFSSRISQYWLKELFRVLDSDKNGQISRDDIKKIIIAADHVSGRKTDDQEQRAEGLFSRLVPKDSTELSCQDFMEGALYDNSVMNDLEEIRSTMRGENRTAPSS